MVTSQSFLELGVKPDLGGHMARSTKQAISFRVKHLYFKIKFEIRLEIHIFKLRLKWKLLVEQGIDIKFVIMLKTHT
jgi:hypothetical protein